MAEFQLTISYGPQLVPQMYSVVSVIPQGQDFGSIRNNIHRAQHCYLLEKILYPNAWDGETNVSVTCLRLLQQMPLALQPVLIPLLLQCQLTYNL